MKCGNLNFLEPSGPLQACYGIALPLPFTVVIEALRYWTYAANLITQIKHSVNVVTTEHIHFSGYFGFVFIEMQAQEKACYII